MAPGNGWAGRISALRQRRVPPDRTRRWRGLAARAARL